MESKPSAYWIPLLAQRYLQFDFSSIFENRLKASVWALDNSRPGVSYCGRYHTHRSGRRYFNQYSHIRFNYSYQDFSKFYPAPRSGGVTGPGSPQTPMRIISRYSQPVIGIEKCSKCPPGIFAIRPITRHQPSAPISSTPTAGKLNPG